MTSETQGQFVFQKISWAFLFRPGVAGHAFYVLEDKGLVVGTFVQVHEPSIQPKLHHDLSLPSKMCERKYLRSMQRMCRESAQVILDRSLFLPSKNSTAPPGLSPFLLLLTLFKRAIEGRYALNATGRDGADTHVQAVHPTPSQRPCRILSIPIQNHHRRASPKKVLVAAVSTQRAGTEQDLRPRWSAEDIAGSDATDEKARSVISGGASVGI
jgi:hypothetical protein